MKPSSSAVHHNLRGDAFKGRRPALVSVGLDKPGDRNSLLIGQHQIDAIAHEPSSVVERLQEPNLAFHDSLWAGHSGCAQWPDLDSVDGEFITAEKASAPTMPLNLSLATEANVNVSSPKCGAYR